MNPVARFHWRTMLAAVLLTFCLTLRLPAQSTSPITALDDAYATLAQCNHDYKGHRVKAMKQIEKAVHELGGRISGHGHGREPQGTSDAQMRAAESLLEQTSGGLPKKVLKHVDLAVDQIKTGLSIR